MRRHAHTVDVLAEITDTTSMLHWTVLEYCPNGDLFTYLTKNGALKESQARKWFRQILIAVHSFHSRGVCHLDLSPENILLDANFDIKVIDFGQACEFLHGYRHNVLREASMPRFGKDFYRAPELNMVNECKEWNPKMADIWSLGILLYVLLTGNPPFSIADRKDRVFNRIYCEGKLRIILQKHIQSSGDDAVDLLMKIFCPLANRLDMDGILEHTWVRASCRSLNNEN